MSRAREKSGWEFKLHAVRLMRDRSASVAHIAADLGVSQLMLYRWQEPLSVDGDQACPGNGRRKADGEEIGKLELENERLREERCILRKAAPSFAEEDKRRGRGR